MAVMKALHLSICIYRYVYQSQKAIIIYKGAKLVGAGGALAPPLFMLLRHKIITGKKF